MASSYSTNLALELIGTGDQAGTWGVTTNTNLGTLIEQAISGYVTQAVATGTDTTITIPNGATGVARNMYIELTGTGGASTNLIVPANKKLYFIFNNSTGAVTVKVTGQTGVSVPQGKKMILVSNGTDIVNGLNYIADFGTNSFTVTNLTASSGTITNLIATTGTITNLAASDASATVLRSASATITNLIAPTTSATVLRSASATITNLIATTASVSDLSATVSRSASATITTINATTVNATTVDATNVEVTNVKAKDGTAAASIADSTGVVSITANPILSGGTANGVLYLNASKVATSGSALTFDGTNLGIGTASPTSSVLHVVSPTASAKTPIKADNPGNTQYGVTFQGRTTGGSDAPVISLENYNGGSPVRYGMSVTSGGALAFSSGLYEAAAGSERMRLDASGNLGIGTASPNARLSLGTPVQNNALYVYDGTAGAKYGFGIASAEFRMYAGSGAVTTFGNYDGTTYTERMRIDSSGNVGIGTTSPGVKLDVAGSGTTAIQVGTMDAKKKALLQYNDSANTFTIGVNDGYSITPIIFRVNGADRMTIDSSGNVGIGGTANADTRLHVLGTAPSSSGNSRGVLATQTIPSSTTGNFIGYGSLPSTQASAFTLSTLLHFWASQSTLGAGSTVTNQYGFYVENSLTGATNNFGFYSDIASGSNRWNFYAAGTALNYFAGDTYVGRTAALYGEDLSVSGYAVIGSNTAGLGQVIIGTDLSTGVNGTVDNVAYVFRTNNTERMRITAAGSVVAGASAALATTATDGFLYVPTCAGTPTGTPTTITGMAPIVVDTTNNKLYFYSGGQWRDAGP